MQMNFTLQAETFGVLTIASQSKTYLGNLKNSALGHFWEIFLGGWGGLLGQHGKFGKFRKISKNFGISGGGQGPNRGVTDRPRIF